MKNKRKLYAEKQARKQTRCLILTLVGIILAIMIIVICFKNSTPHVKPLPTKVVPSQYSLQKMQEFWTNHFQQIFDRELLVNKYPLPKIQERFNLLDRKINERYHTNFHVGLNIGYNAESKQILAGSGIVEGCPRIEIVIPGVIDIYRYQQQKNEPGWEKTMYYLVTVSILHELDHLAFGAMKGTREHPQSLDELVDDERKVWALTCEHTLRPLIEEYQVKLTENEYFFYNKWLEVGRNANNPPWKDFIYQNYKTTR